MDSNEFDILANELRDNYKRQLELYERIKSTMQEHQCSVREACVLLGIIVDD